MPLEFMNWVPVIPRRCASRFIMAAKVSSEPAMASARATQASFPDWMIMPWMSSSTVTGMSGAMNMREPSIFQARVDTGTT